MKKENNNIWKLAFIISVIIIVVMAVILVTVMVKNNGSFSHNSGVSNSSQEHEVDIRVEEDLMKYGTIQNLDNVNWSNARISQYDNEMLVYISLNNQSEKEKVDPTQLQITLFDENGKEFYSTEIMTEEIKDQFGSYDLQFSVPMSKIQIVHDINIVAKTESNVNE